MPGGGPRFVDGVSGYSKQEQIVAVLFSPQVRRVTLKCSRLRARYCIMVRLSCMMTWTERFLNLIDLETPQFRWGSRPDCRESDTISRGWRFADATNGVP